MGKADRNEQQLDFKSLQAMRWEELPAPLRAQVRELMRGLLCAVAADVRTPRDGDDHDAA